MMDWMVNEGCSIGYLKNRLDIDRSGEARRSLKLPESREPDEVEATLYGRWSVSMPDENEELGSSWTELDAKVKSDYAD